MLLFIVASCEVNVWLRDLIFSMGLLSLFVMCRVIVRCVVKFFFCFFLVFIFFVPCVIISLMCWISVFSDSSVFVYFGIVFLSKVSCLRVFVFVLLFDMVFFVDLIVVMMFVRFMLVMWLMSSRVSVWMVVWYLFDVWSVNWNCVYSCYWIFFISAIKGSLGLFLANSGTSMYERGKMIFWMLRVCVLLMKNFSLCRYLVLLKKCGVMIVMINVMLDNVSSMWLCYWLFVELKKIGSLLLGEV